MIMPESETISLGFSGARSLDLGPEVSSLALEGLEGSVEGGLDMP